MHSRRSTLASASLGRAIARRVRDDPVRQTDRLLRAAARWSPATLRRYEARMRTACDNEFRQSPRRIARELTALAALPAWFVLYNSASALTASAKSTGDSQRIIFFFLFIPTITVYALISTIYHSRRRAIMRTWHTKTCLRCHYPINTPPPARCPECGLEFPHILFPPWHHATRHLAQPHLASLTTTTTSSGRFSGLARL